MIFVFFLKECISLTNNHHVSLIVADGKKDEIKDSVHIYDVGPSKGRLDRILNVPKRILKKGNRAKFGYLSPA
ncbi:hypothetical protein [Xenorhabdus nematophila]|uniref:hypothetical protein n=1 Tax=Xenorhabdus nematophila TaxID=628 RepID=UPI001F4158D4|nr:hypothetical protein [Xenorhabdus nematophila]